MIPIKTDEQIEIMRANGKILSDTLRLIEENIAAGVSTLRLDSIARSFIEKNDAKPSFLGMYGFPCSLCISIDDEVIHGIPSAHIKLEEGMLVSVDAGVFKNGLHVDAARTFLVGEVSAEKRRLAAVAKECFIKATRVIHEGARVGDIGFTVESKAHRYGYAVVRKYVGHGVGEKLHEQPSIPNYGKLGKGDVLMSGMTLAIEPMINLKSGDVFVCKDGWTVKTVDKQPSAHYENTVLVTVDGCEVLTEQ